MFTLVPKLEKYTELVLKLGILARYGPLVYVRLGPSTHCVVIGSADDGKHVATDNVVFHNQYWASNTRRRRLRKKHLRYGSLESLMSML